MAKSMTTRQFVELNSDSPLNKQAIHVEESNRTREVAFLL